MKPLPHIQARYSHQTSPTMVMREGAVCENLPPRTIIIAKIATSERSSINVELWLPQKEQWNGCFLGVGNGGSAGSIYQGHLAASVAQGYAVAATDMGTAPHVDVGIGNPEVWKDFGYRSTHLMTVFAKQKIYEHYGVAPRFCYFHGRSTGGQQALQEAQRYPEDYDGIIAEVPGHCRTPLHAYFLWSYQILSECPFSDAQKAGVIAAGNAFMAAREIPLVAGRFISDPRCNEEEIEQIIALAANTDPTLGKAHVEALRLLLKGPRHAQSTEVIFGGMPPGTFLDITERTLYPFRWVFGESMTLHTLNFANDIDTYTAALGPYLNAENPDLSAFAQRGGKLLITSASADPIVPFHTTLDYYQRVVERMGGLEHTQSFCRCYLAPGMGHSRNGPGVKYVPDLLPTIRAWREEGVAPYQLRGHLGEGFGAVCEMPLYPYPLQTGWDEQEKAFCAVRMRQGGFVRTASRFSPEPVE